MGCGASKNVAIVDAPVAAPKTNTAPVAQQQVVQAENKPTLIVAATPAPTPTPAPAAEPEPTKKQEEKNEADKDEAIGNNKQAAVVADVVAEKKKEVIVLTKQHSTPDSACDSLDGSSTDLTSDAGVAKGTSRLRAALAAAPSTSSEESSSTDDAEFVNVNATISERPSSRGGMAFDMTFDGQQSRQQAPARLEKLRTRTRSAEMSISELQEKLAAAESRRQTYEARLKEKLSKENEKVEKVQQQHTTIHATTPTKVKVETDTKENKALENRESNLRQIRERLKAKEEHAKKVREAKRLSGNAADFAFSDPIPAPNVVTAN